MRKTILLLAFLVSVVTFTSCSSDDNNPTKDSIIGKWEVTKVLENGVEKDLGCDQKGIVEYKSDGTFSYEEYSISDTTGDCVFIKNNDGNTWKNNDDGTYEFVEESEKYTEKIDFGNNIHTGTYKDMFGVTVEITYTKR